MTRDTGIRGIFPGFRFKDKVQEDLRSQMEIRNRIETMTRADPIQPINLGYSPVLNLKPTEILHKEGEYGHRVASHNKKFPRHKTTVLPKEKQQPQYGVKPIDGHDRSTFPYNQKEALATAGAMDKAVANTKTRINQIHKNPASKIIEKEQAIKDLQRITDIAYDYSNDPWEHRPEWKLDRKTGSPVDVADPNHQPAKKPAPRGRDFYFNAAENAMELVSEPSPHRPTLQAAGKADPTSGSKYVPKEQRIYEAIKLPGYETLAASDKSFAKLEANRKLEDERSKRRNAKFI